MFARYTLQSQYLYARNHLKWLSPECAAVGGGLSTCQPNATAASLPQCSFDFESPLEGFAVLLLGVIGTLLLLLLMLLMLLLLLMLMMVAPLKATVLHVDAAVHYIDFCCYCPPVVA